MGVNSPSSILLLVNKKMYNRLHIHTDYLPLVHKESHKKLPIHDMCQALGKFHLKLEKVNSSIGPLPFWSWRNNFVKSAICCSFY